MTESFDRAEDAVGVQSDAVGPAGHSCDFEAHTNPFCTCNTTDSERADMLAEYVDRVTEEFGERPLLMPLKDEGKYPVIKDRCRLYTAQARSLLVTSDEAKRRIREEGVRGFAIYAGKKSHSTEHLALVDHDDTDAFPAPTGEPTLEVLSGSGRGTHETYRNNSDDPVRRAIVGDGLGEIKAKNWFCITPGSVHPSGGVYHIVKRREIATVSDADLTDEMRPAGSAGASDNTTPEDEFDFDAEDIDALPDGFDADAVENDFGMSLRAVRRMSEELDRLLNPPTTGHPTPSHADMATVSQLLRWWFDEPDIADILRACRAREKLNRDEYIAETIRKTSLTEVGPVDPDLMVAQADNVNEQNGRAIVSVESLCEAQVALQVLGEGTTAELGDLGSVDWDDSKPESVRRRLRRALTVLEEAGYVSSEPDPRDRRRTLWRDEKLEELQLPGYD